MQIDLNIQIGQNMQIHDPRDDEFISCVEDEGIELTDWFAYRDEFIKGDHAHAIQGLSE